MQPLLEVLMIFSSTLILVSLAYIFVWRVQFPNYIITFLRLGKSVFISLQRLP